MTSLAQEIVSIAAWRRGDRHALGEVLKAYDPLIKARARAAHLKNPDVQLDDFIQAARVGFIIACKNFDERRGARVARIAEFYIKTEFHALLISKRVTSANSSQHLRALFNRLPREARTRGFDLSRLSEAQAAEIASSFLCSREHVSAVAAFISSPRTVLDAHDMPTIAPSQSDALVENRTRAVIESALESIPERERLIVELNVLRDPKITLDKIGVMVGLTEERARQLRNVGLGRIRAHFDARGIESSDLFSEVAE